MGQLAAKVCGAARGGQLAYTLERCRVRLERQERLLRAGEEALARDAAVALWEEAGAVPLLGGSEAWGSAEGLARLARRRRACALARERVEELQRVASALEAHAVPPQLVPALRDLLYCAASLPELRDLARLRAALDAALGRPALAGLEDGHGLVAPADAALPALLFDAPDVCEVEALLAERLAVPIVRRYARCASCAAPGERAGMVPAAGAFLCARCHHQVCPPDENVAPDNAQKPEKSFWADLRGAVKQDVVSLAGYAKQVLSPRLAPA